MSKELPCHVSDFLVLHMIGNGIVIMCRVDLTQLHVVNADAVISECLSMDITNSSADLEEFLILSNCILEFTKVVEKNTRAVVCSSFISRFTCSLACEGQNVIIFQSLLGCNSIVRISVAHGQSGVVVHNVLFKVLIFLDQSLLGDDVFLSLGRIEINWQFNSLSLVYSQREITFLLKVTESESLQILLSQGLAIENSSWRNLTKMLSWRSS